MGLTKWNFQRELVEICKRCTNVKLTTAQVYASQLFKKYEDEIMHYDKDSYERNINIAPDLRNAIRCIKKGAIEYNKGMIKLEDISEASFVDDTWKVFTKNQKEYHFGKEFRYLKYVFNSDYY